VADGGGTPRGDGRGCYEATRLTAAVNDSLWMRLTPVAVMSNST